MKKWLLHIIVCLSAFLMNACTNEVDTIAKDGDKVRLQLHLALPVGETQGESRAYMEYPEDGTDLENYVDFTDDTKYRIYLFGMDDKFIARFIPESVEMTIANHYKLYSVEGEVPDGFNTESGTVDFKIVVLANWSEYQEPNETTEIESICNAEWAVFDHLEDFQLSWQENRLMPFYGVQEYKDITFKNGETKELEDPIHLLRAMAKVEVILDTSDDENGKYQTDVSFSKVVVHNYNSQGYCAPSGVYKQADYVYSNGNFIDDLSLHVVDNVKVNDELLFLQVNKRSEDENEKWIAYLPEYDNSGTDYSYIEVTLDSQIASYQIYFSKYVDGVKTEPFFNIARNNLYRFNVRIRSGKLEVNVLTWKNAYDNNYTFE